MKIKLHLLFYGWLVLLSFNADTFGQQHIATRLGFPSTRFADPLVVPDDLRRLFASEALRKDIDFIARESGFKGDLNDLRRAAASSNIIALKIPKGTLLPAMSTRRGGKLILLREVLWAGKEPIDAYEFYFVSQGRQYRVVTPKPCSNFWVEDQGKERKPVLTLKCELPSEVPHRRNFDVCFLLTNTGDQVEHHPSITVPLPAGAQFVTASTSGELVNNRIHWELPPLPPGATAKVCATVSVMEPGLVTFACSAQGRVAPPVETQCDLRIIGIPAILIELVDVVDPIQMEENETYHMFVLNQGTSTLTNVKVTCTIDPESQKFVSGWSVRSVSENGATIELEALPRLEINSKANWQVVVKVLKPGDIRFTMEVTTDEFPSPIKETESTHQY